MQEDEEEWLPISALQHLAFCPRQCALIHLEQVWAENVFTVQGKHLHEKAHEAGTVYSGDVRVARSLRLRSSRLKLTGVADVVEFHKDSEGTELASVPGRWRPYPVEYKRGKSKLNSCDRVQLCAQALCLEEMLGVTISEGSLFYGEPRRREIVSLDEELRIMTHTYVSELHALFRAGITPPGIYEKKCRSCSLIDICAPKIMQKNKSATSYMTGMLNEIYKGDE